MRRVLPLLMIVSGLAAGCADADEAGRDPSVEASDSDALDADELEARRRGGPSHGGKPGSALDAGVSRDAGRPVFFAAAKLAPKSGNTTLRGEAFFTKQRRGAQLTLYVEGAPPGKHGAHLHAVGDCSAPDATSAGGHWNPENAQHGAPGPSSHLGDLGSITIGQSGRGLLLIDNDKWTLGGGAPTDLIGKAVVIHADADDFTTQPTGNAGGRIGCGVIQAH